ncbi:MAG: twin-arginine translocase TatA/TatE family subunit [Peptococcaceae bacterium]|nr:twin-arginine translocase TatA/TatE family subunit [Peptococcaceae bacterium]
MGEMILILVIALIIFGPGKLPDAGKALGKTIREFRRASEDVMDDITPKKELPPNPLRTQTETADTGAEQSVKQ